MKTNPHLLVFCISVFLFQGLPAQDLSNTKFGKISNTDFQLTAEKFDSGANAVIIADIGNVKFEGNNEGSFSVVSTHFIRVKLNKAFFPTEEYSVLRDFFANVVKKENEQFLFKKIK
jgi:hypothetical protein